MNEMAPQVLFVIFGALMLVSAAGVLYARNPVYAAMNLVASFFFLAAIYALLYAHTLAVLQILVYAGAIMVLFLFVIMLLSLQEPEKQPLNVTPTHVLVVLSALAILGAVLHATVGSDFHAKVTSIDSSAGTAVFDSSPFQSSAYLGDEASLGEVITSTGMVLHVTGVTGDGPRPQHRLDSLGSLQPGQEVTLRWNVSGLDRRFGTVAELGAVMFSRFLLPFEVTSLLLLVASVGAVVVAKEKI
jgi:NADH-quinone oxidoreductase subunit J